jgi:hypothetical protein
MAFGFDSNGTQVVVNDPFIDGDERAGLRWIFQPLAAVDTLRKPRNVSKHPWRIP